MHGNQVDNSFVYAVSEETQKYEACQTIYPRYRSAKAARRQDTTAMRRDVAWRIIMASGVHFSTLMVGIF